MSGISMASIPEASRRNPLLLTTCLCLIYSIASPLFARNDPIVLPEGGKSAAAFGANIPFIANQGQLNEPAVMFYAQTFGGTVYVTAEGRIVYAFPRIASDPSAPADSPAARRLSGGSVFSEVLVGTDKEAAPEGTDRSMTRVNWFVGSDPDRWRSDIPAYESVKFGDVYEGIELTLRAHGDNVEKIFTVAPGADPARIGMRFDGVDAVSVMPDGRLELMTAFGPVRFTAPIAFQTEDESPEIKDLIHVAYRVEGGVVGFELGPYDMNRPLVIDPLVASTFLGGGSEDVIRAMGMHSWTNEPGGANIFVAGWTASSDFPAGNGSSYSEGNFNGFVSRFDDTLMNLTASTFLGGSSNDMIYALAVRTNDSSVVVAGYTESDDFAGTTGQYSGSGDAFVAVLNSNLIFQSSRLLGGDDVDCARGVALGVGENDSIYITGYTASTNFPTAPIGGVYQDELEGGKDAFVARLSADLVELEASTYLGGSDDDAAYAIAVDANNNVFVTGWTDSGDFPGDTEGDLDNRNMFLAKFVPALTSTEGSVSFGGTGDDVAYGLAVDKLGRPVVVGYTTSGNYPRNPDTGNVFAPGYTNMPMGGKDAVITRWLASLLAVQRSTYMGGAGDEAARGIFIDSMTNIHVTGWTTSSNFPVTTNAYNTVPSGGKDVFLSSFGASLTNLQVSTYLGGGFDDIGHAILQTPGISNIFVAGATDSGNFPRTVNAYQQFADADSQSGFISKFVRNYSYGTERWRYSLEYDTGIYKTGPTFGPDGTTLYIAIGGGLANAYLFAATTDGVGTWINNHLVSPAFLKSTPAVTDDGTIYICSSTNLYAIASGGNIVRTIGFPRAIYGAPALGADGTVYVLSFGLTPVLYAINQAGNIQWERALTGDFAWSSPVIGTDGTIYAATDGGDASLHSINPVNGTVNWRADLTDDFSGTYGTPAIGSNNMIYVQSGGDLLAFNAGGVCVWTNKLNNVSDGELQHSSPVIGVDGSVYIGQSNWFFSVDGDTGNTNFIWALGGKVDSSAAIGEYGSIYVGAGNKLFSLNPDTGTTNWAFDAGGAIGLSSPLLGSDGTIYIAGGTNLFAIWGREEPADTPWPMFQHDQHRTRNAALGALAPGAPTNISASVNIPDRIRVTWNNVPQVPLYEVWRSPDTNAANAIYIGTAGTNSYDDGFVPIGYNYYYWIRSKNAMKSGELSVNYALGGRPTLPPDDLDATKGFPEEDYRTEASVWWLPCSGNYVNYHLYRNTVNNSNNATRIAASTSLTNFMDNAAKGMTPGITNYYWVRSLNLTTTSIWSKAALGGIAPNPPIVTAVQGTTTNYLEVNWSVPAGSYEYRVFRSTNTVFEHAECLDENVETMFYRDGTEFGEIPIPYRPYTYWVMATNVFGVSDKSASSTGFRALHPPKSVLATKGNPSNRVDLSWSIHTEFPRSYAVYRNTEKDPAGADKLFEIIYHIDGTNYNDNSITRGLAYYYWVTASNLYGESARERYDIGGTPPTAPGNVSVSAGSFVDRIEVDWSASTGADGYMIYRSTFVDPNQAQRVGTSKTTGFEDMMEVVPGVRYYYWVKATNAFGISLFSGFDSGWRDLSPPTGVTASDGVSTAHVAVAWNASENADRYDVWRGTNSNLANARELASDLTAKIYHDIAVTAGQVYYYWLKAKNAEFASGFSKPDTGFSSLGNLDIGVSEFIFQPPATGPGARPDAVSFRVTNHGEDDMFAPNFWVACDFYISENATFTRDTDIPIGGIVRSIDLDAGDSAVVTLTPSERAQLRIPQDALGEYYVFVHINHVLPSAWIDPNMKNNTAARFGGPIRVREKTPAPFKTSDFTGDGRTDLALYHETTGMWFVRGMDGTPIVWGANWGGPGFRPMAGDFDGNGIVDMAVYHQETGTWYVRRLDGSLILWGEEWGGPGFTPVWGDYSGNGAVDLCVYHEETGAWFIRTVAGDLVAWSQNWGGPGSIPAPGDYDGDGKSDLAVFFQGKHNWFIWCMSGAVPAYGLSWGGPDGFTPVPGDYNGDGLADLAVYHNLTGYWFILSLADGELIWGEQWGGPGFTPVTGDFNGDGKSDMAIYNEAAGTWFVRSVAGETLAWEQPWGGPGFTPIGLGQ